MKFDVQTILAFLLLLAAIAFFSVRYYKNWKRKRNARQTNTDCGPECKCEK